MDVRIDPVDVSGCINWLKTQRLHCQRKINFGHLKFVRIHDDIETAMYYPSKTASLLNIFSIICGKKQHKKDVVSKGNFLEKRLSRVFSENYDIVTKRILDPRGDDLSRWNRCFLVACLVSLFVDPLFFYLPEVRSHVHGCKYTS